MSKIKPILKHKNVFLHKETHAKIVAIANLENRKINNQITEIVEFYIKHKKLESVLKVEQS